MSEVGRFGCAFFAQAAHSFPLAHALVGQRPRGYWFPLHCTAVCMFSVTKKEATSRWGCNSRKGIDGSLGPMCKGILLTFFY